METGATKGAIGGAIAGAGVLGLESFGVGAVPGAIYGGVVGGVVGWVEGLRLFAITLEHMIILKCAVDDQLLPTV